MAEENDEILSAKEWETFDALLDKIVKSGAPFADKATTVKAHLDDTNLQEFVSWFDQ
jgi:hypothetical protein